MAKVSLHNGFTIHVGSPMNNEYARFDVNIDQVDTDLPIEPQLQAATEAIKELWPILYAAIDKMAEETMGITIGRRKA